jgi:hypothetical protein
MPMRREGHMLGRLSYPCELMTLLHYRAERNWQQVAHGLVQDGEDGLRVLDRGSNGSAN